MSPTQALVAKASAWISVPGFLYILAVWEIAIGVCFLSRRRVPWSVVLFEVPQNMRYVPWTANSCAPCLISS